MRYDAQTLTTEQQAQARTNIGAAAASHSHEIANVNGLQTALDGKQAKGSYLTTSAASSTYLTKTDASNTYLGKTANAPSASKLATARTIKATGDASWSVSFNGSADASGTLTLANSGVTAGSYGQSAAATPAFGGTFYVPRITVDAKGRVTAITHYTVKIPAAPTSVSGNAGTATKLATARTISITGDATGSTTFDGGANKSISITLGNKVVGINQLEDELDFGEI